MNKHILLLGPPACGKGTQARQLAAYLEVPCLGTGKLLRNEIKQGTETGIAAKEFIDRGEYVPDAVIMRMVELWMDENKSGWILDGFPRTKPQAEALNEMRKPDMVIALDVPQEDLEFRITRRRECVKCGVTVAVDSAEDTDCPECDGGNLVSRSDDALDSFKIRYVNYSELTVPLFDYYDQQGILKHLDGTMKPDEVYQAILKLL